MIVQHRCSSMCGFWQVKMLQSHIFQTEYVARPCPHDLQSRAALSGRGSCGVLGLLHQGLTSHHRLTLSCTLQTPRQTHFKCFCSLKTIPWFETPGENILPWCGRVRWRQGWAHQWQAAEQRLFALTDPWHHLRTTCTMVKMQSRPATCTRAAQRMAATVPPCETWSAASHNHREPVSWCGSMAWAQPAPAGRLQPAHAETGLCNSPNVDGRKQGTRVQGGAALSLVRL